MKKRQKLLAAGLAGVLVLGVCAWRSPALRRMLIPQAVAAYAPAQLYERALSPEDQSLWQKGTRFLSQLAENAAGVGPAGEQLITPDAGDLLAQVNIPDAPAVGPGLHHHQPAEGAEQPAAPVAPEKPAPKDPAPSPEPERKVAPPTAGEPGMMPGPVGEKDAPRETKIAEPGKEKAGPALPEKGKSVGEPAPVHYGPLKEEHHVPCHP